MSVDSEELSDRVEELAKEKDVSKSEILGSTLLFGIEALWRQSILSKYLEGEIEREEAIDKVGLEKVKRAEKEVEVIEEDIEWVIQHKGNTRYRPSQLLLPERKELVSEHIRSN